MPAAGAGRQPCGCCSRQSGRRQSPGRAAVSRRELTKGGRDHAALRAAIPRSRLGGRLGEPGLTAFCRVKYNGTLSNGQKFDEGSAEFRVNEVVPGWTEALQSMVVGGA